jgi:hypothetical protein
MRLIRSLFKRAQPDAPPAPPAIGRLTLPLAVGEAIDSASLVVRPGTENGARVVCQFEGMRGFVLTEEGGAEAMAAIFPDLDERQLALAVRRLRGRAKAHLRGVGLAHRDTRPWKDRY